MCLEWQGCVLYVCKMRETSASPKARPTIETTKLLNVDKVSGSNGLGEDKPDIPAPRDRSIQYQAGGSPRYMAPFFRHELSKFDCQSCSVLVVLADRKLPWDRSLPTSSS